MNCQLVFNSVNAEIRICQVSQLFWKVCSFQFKSFPVNLLQNYKKMSWYDWQCFQSVFWREKSKNSRWPDFQTDFAVQFRRVHYRVLQQLAIHYLPCSNANHDNFPVSLYLVASKKTVFKRVLFAHKKTTSAN